MTSSVNDESRGQDDTDASTELNNVAEESILNLLIDNSKLQDQKLKVFLAMLERLCRDNHLLIHMNFPEDHPVEEVGRFLLAVLIKYQGLEQVINKMIENEIESPGNMIYSFF